MFNFVSLKIQESLGQRHYTSCCHGRCLLEHRQDLLLSGTTWKESNAVPSSDRVYCHYHATRIRS